MGEEEIKDSSKIYDLAMSIQLYLLNRKHKSVWKYGDMTTFGFQSTIFDMSKGLECESADEEKRSELARGILNPSL